MSERDKAIEEAREFCYRCPNPPENWDLRGTSESMADFALDYHAKQNAEAEKKLAKLEAWVNGLRAAVFHEGRANADYVLTVSDDRAWITQGDAVLARETSPLAAIYAYLEQVEGGEEKG